MISVLCVVPCPQVCLVTDDSSAALLPIGCWGGSESEERDFPARCCVQALQGTWASCICGIGRSWLLWGPWRPPAVRLVLVVNRTRKLELLTCFHVKKWKVFLVFHSFSFCEESLSSRYKITASTLILHPFRVGGAAGSRCFWRVLRPSMLPSSLRWLLGPKEERLNFTSSVFIPSKQSSRES